MITDKQKAKILQLRALNYTQKEIADKTGISKSEVGRLLKGIEFSSPKQTPSLNSGPANNPENIETVNQKDTILLL